MSRGYEGLSKGAKKEIDDIVDKADMMTYAERQGLVEAISMREFAGGPMSPDGIKLDRQVAMMVNKKLRSQR